MKSSFKPIGDFIELVDERNTDLRIENLVGLTINKNFIPSVANTIDSDMTNYKIIHKGQFACSLMQVRRDKKIPVALMLEFEKAIISQAYPVFKIKNENELLPEYLMMWMSRSEFDREACFYAVGGVRGSLEWEDFCAMELPIPPIEKQREIVKEYHTITNRIALNEQLNRKLEETAQAIYKQWFVDFEFPISKEYGAEMGKPELEGRPYKSSGGEMVWNEELGKGVPKGWEVKFIEQIIPVKDGTHDSPNPTDNGYSLVTSAHLEPYSISLHETYNISEEDFKQVNKRSKVDAYDILFSMIGTVGSISFILDEKINFAIKNVGLFKGSEKPEFSNYLLFYLKSKYTTDFIKSSLLGSTQNYVTLTLLRSIPVILPPKIVINDASKILSLSSLYQYKKANEIKKLINLKDLFLSKMTKVGG